MDIWENNTEMDDKEEFFMSPEILDIEFNNPALYCWGPWLEFSLQIGCFMVFDSHIN
jgi:hypothetical protein